MTTRPHRIPRALALTAVAAIAVVAWLTVGSGAFQIPPIFVASPTVQLTTPARTSSLIVNVGVALEASVAKPVSEVAFFSNGNSIGRARSAPYSVTWTPTTQGTYMLHAVATELSGASSRSAQVAVTVTTPQLFKLVQKGDLVYQGAFRLPLAGFGSDTFAWGGTAVGFNPEKGTLLLVGHDHRQQVAEISIPEIRIAARVADYATATLVQPLTDVLEGRVREINPSDPNSKKIGGLLPYQGRLHVTAYSFYDGSGSQSASHFISGLDLPATGDLTGPYRVGSQPVGFISGYFALVPPAWRPLFGGPVLNGNCCLSIISRTSYGPAAFVIDPSTIGSGATPVATPLVYYTPTRPLARWEETGTSFNGATTIRGLVFPDSTRSVLFFGKHGTGTFCYGDGNTCKDPTEGSQGTHAYPYRYQVWAYDALDLLAVKDKTRQPEDVRPYAIWALDIPPTAHQVDIQGATYDPATGRIFVVQKFGDGEKPLVHVFMVAL